MPSAHQITWAKFRVFAVAVAGFSILSVLAYLLTGGTLFEPKSTLYVYLPDATGLGAGSLVRVNGVDVGKVQYVALSGSNQQDRIVQVALQMEEPYLAGIPADSYAQIESDTALGDKYLNITRGASPSPVQPNAELPFHPQAEVFKTQDIIQFTTELRTVDDLLDQIEQQKNPTGQLLLSDQLYNQIREIISGFDKDIHNLRNPKNPIGKLLYTDEDYQRFRQPLLRLDQEIADIQEGRTQLGKLIHDENNYKQLMARLTDLRESIRRVNTNVLLASDETYTQWNRELTSLIETVDQWNENPLLTTSATYDNLTGFLSQLRDTLHEFRENPQKFLRIKIF
jgi:phospholipid/cholesterol/gamma-HCH transport system substrate-binding protein